MREVREELVCNVSSSGRSSRSSGGSGRTTTKRTR